MKIKKRLGVAEIAFLSDFCLCQKIRQFLAFRPLVEFIKVKFYSLSDDINTRVYTQKNYLHNKSI